MAEENMMGGMDAKTIKEERKRLKAEQKEQMEATVLKIGDDIEVNGAYYGWFFSNAYLTLKEYKEKNNLTADLETDEVIEIEEETESYTVRFTGNPKAIAQLKNVIAREIENLDLSIEIL